MFPLSSAYIFIIWCSALLEGLYLFTFYALRCHKTFRNFYDYLGINILQPSPILPNLNWANNDPKHTCYQVALLGVIKNEIIVRWMELRLNLVFINILVVCCPMNKLRLWSHRCYFYKITKSWKLFIKNFKRTSSCIIRLKNQ